MEKKRKNLRVPPLCLRNYWLGRAPLGLSCKGFCVSSWPSNLSILPGLAFTMQQKPAKITSKNGSAQENVFGTFKLVHWTVLSDEQMSNGWSFSLLNDEQMSNKVRVEHQPVQQQSTCFTWIKEEGFWVWFSNSFSPKPNIGSWQRISCKKRIPFNISCNHYFHNFSFWPRIWKNTTANKTSSSWFGNGLDSQGETSLLGGSSQLVNGY